MSKRKVEDLQDPVQSSTPVVLPIASRHLDPTAITDLTQHGNSSQQLMISAVPTIPSNTSTSPGGSQSCWGDMPPPPAKRLKLSDKPASEIETEKDNDSSDDEYASDPNDSDCSTSSQPSTTGPKTKLRPKNQICTWPGCTKRYNRPTRLESHIRSHTGERPFACIWPGCDKTYIEAKHLTQHIEGKHENKRNHACPFPDCGRAFFTSTRLGRHVSSHIKAQQFQCKGHGNCKQVFRRRDTLNRHIRQVHLKLPGYMCPESNCTEAFASSGALRNHKRRAHGELKHFCDECKITVDGETRSLGFTTVSELRTHFKTAHMTCSFCSYRCTYPSEMDRHVSIHHSAQTVHDRKNVACPWEGCDKKFTKKSNLNAHIKSSHDGYRFVCGLVDLSGSDGLAGWDNSAGCHEGFVTKANLESHVRHVHLGIQREPTAATRVRSVVDEVAGLQDVKRRTIKCEWCSRGFIRYHDLQVHKTLDHAAEIAATTGVVMSLGTNTASIASIEQIALLERQIGQETQAIQSSAAVGEHLDQSNNFPIYHFPGTPGFVSPALTPMATSTPEITSLGLATLRMSSQAASPGPIIKNKNLNNTLEGIPPLDFARKMIPPTHNSGHVQAASPPSSSPDVQCLSPKINAVEEQSYSLPVQTILGPDSHAVGPAPPITVSQTQV